MVGAQSCWLTGKDGSNKMFMDFYFGKLTNIVKAQRWAKIFWVGIANVGGGNGLVWIHDDAQGRQRFNLGVIDEVAIQELRRNLKN